MEIVKYIISSKVNLLYYDMRDIQTYTLWWDIGDVRIIGYLQDHYITRLVYKKKK